MTVKSSQNVILRSKATKNLTTMRSLPVRQAGFASLRMTVSKNVLLSIVFVGLFLFLSTDAHAIFTLSVAPRRGGQGIRFEAAKPGALLRNEEVTFTVTSTHVVQYRILQTVYQPLTNELGNTIPQGALIAFSPSNPLGILRTQLETPVMMGQQPIYTSNAAGDSDSFVLVYNVRVPENQPGGVYHTNITFTAEPVNMQAGVSPSILTMDIRVEINPTFKIELQNGKGGHELDLGRILKDKPVASDSLKFSIESNIGTTYRIVQQMTEPLISQEGATFDESNFSFTSAGGSKGTLKAAGVSTPVPQSATLFYTSNEAGAGDVIALQYELKPDLAQKAGIYSGKISFKVESNSAFAPFEVINVPVKIEIEPVFYLDYEIDAQATGLEFGTYKTGEEKQERKVLLTVHSNLSQPYQVTQIVPRKLTNPEGMVLPKEHFKYFGSDAKTGILTVMSPMPVEEGERVVFTSDKKGTPEKFSIYYILTVPVNAASGTYNSEIKYSITTL